MEQILQFVKPELLALIPVLYFIGTGLKKANWLSDKMIPVCLGVLGVLLSAVYVLASSAAAYHTWHDVLLMVFTAVVQGVLTAGCSTFWDQIKKQLKKPD